MWRSDAGVDELEAVRAALVALVPVWDGAGVLDLVRVLAHKLQGHDDCGRLLHPSPGSLGVDEARERCGAVLSALAPVERSAVLSLLAADHDWSPNR